jgi:hypothetical protein
MFFEKNLKTGIGGSSFSKNLNKLEAEDETYP